MCIVHDGTENHERYEEEYDPAEFGLGEHLLAFLSVFEPGKSIRRIWSVHDDDVGWMIDEAVDFVSDDRAQLLRSSPGTWPDDRSPPAP